MNRRGSAVPCWRGTAKAFGKWVSSVRWHCSGDALASGATDGTVRVWRRRRGAEGSEAWGCEAVLEGFDDGSWLECRGLVP